MGNLIYLLPLLLLAWLFLTQRRRQKQTRAAQDAIAVGDQVSTTSGLLGTLVALNDDEGTIEVSPGVTVRFVRRAIVPRQQVGAPADGATQSSAIHLDKHDSNAPETKAE